jgi:mRNA interferase RelE/StbE
MNLKGSWDLRVNDEIWKQVAKFPRHDRGRIRSALRELTDNPFIGNVKKMQGQQNAWRRRIGAYRILFEILTKERIIYVAAIKRRVSKTY